MTSTEFNIGLTEEKCSSRVLKPPGGGSSDIFGVTDAPSTNGSEKPAATKAAPPAPTPSDIPPAATPAPDAQHVRPKYNQQNSSNLNAIMGTRDPNQKGGDSSGDNNSGNESKPRVTNDPAANSGARVRQPPGGYSSGLW